MKKLSNQQRILLAKNRLVPRTLQFIRLYKVSPPNFFILGAQKAGTSSLFAMLNEHPEILGPVLGKELQFFNRIENLSKSKIREYERLFFPDWMTRQKKTFEATPGYLFYERVPGILKDYAPSAKFIILLRDPVERAFSHWRMMHFKWARLNRKDAESRSFAEVCSDENHEIIQRGIYVQQLKRYFDLFDSDQFLILDSHNLLENTQVVLDQVTEFLGVERRLFAPKFSHQGEGPSIPDQETVQRLKEFYTLYNEELRLFLDNLGVRMSWL